MCASPVLKGSYSSGLVLGTGATNECIPTREEQEEDSSLARQSLNISPSIPLRLSLSLRRRRNGTFRAALSEKAGPIKKVYARESVKLWWEGVERVAQSNSGV